MQLWHDCRHRQCMDLLDTLGINTVNAINIQFDTQRILVVWDDNNDADIPMHQWSVQIDCTLNSVKQCKRMLITLQHHICHFTHLTSQGLVWVCVVVILYTLPLVRMLSLRVEAPDSRKGHLEGVPVLEFERYASSLARHTQSTEWYLPCPLDAMNVVRLFPFTQSSRLALIWWSDVPNTSL